MRRSSLMCLILVFTAAELSAQSTNADSSVRIRLVPANSEWKPLIGVVVSMGLDTIQLVPDGRKDTVKVLTAGLSRVERSTSRRSNTSRGLLTGLLVGAAVGGGAGYLLRSSGSPAGEAEPWVVPAGIGAGALLGGVVGGVRGATSNREQWDAMPTITAEHRSSSGERHGGVRIGLAARFGF